METGATVSCDPMAWFFGGLISNPSMMIYGAPGLGKSSLAERLILGLAYTGIVPLVLGDLKPDYSRLIEALGGKVVRLGEGQRLNVLDQGSLLEAADLIGGEKGDSLRYIAQQRAANLVVTLLQLLRKGTLEDWESALVSRAVNHLFDSRRAAGITLPPVLEELCELLADPTEELMTCILVSNLTEYQEAAKKLLLSMNSLIGDTFGKIFNGQTTQRLPLDAPAVSIDISALHQQSDDLLAAVLLATWSEGYASVEAANALADAGKGPQKHYLIVMDEMWRPLRIGGAQLVDRLDGLTRLNRNEGVGNLYIAHTPKDQKSMASQADAVKALGFTERSGIVATAGLAKEDLRALSDVKPMTEKEIDRVAGWNTPPGWAPKLVRDTKTGELRPTPPPGAGKFLIKVGDRAGIQVQVKLTQTELDLHDTNARWVGGERENKNSRTEAAHALVMEGTNRG
ncbi:ATP/GTP-binding protein [Paeniglutamicibacter sp. NPDC091659]|uniref:ATP/GTP-binding protein n=1 Tax=Paeniglutamicibacter sp. NPDC091659 TaxID=3364389 RepID=UPI003816A483